MCGSGVSGERRVCPYCSTVVPDAETTSGHTVKFSIPAIVSATMSRSRTVQATDVRCRMCEREYELLEIGDPEWFANQVSMSDQRVTDDLANIFGAKVYIQKAPDMIKGFALKGDGTVDMCLARGGKRAAVTCAKDDRGKYKGIVAREIRFGK